MKATQTRGLKPQRPIPKLSPLDLKRFWNRVHKTKSCWAWDHKSVKGYGVFNIQGKNILAHRVSWTINRGKIPHGLCVLHKCDNPICVNPKHLFLGTYKHNHADMMKKGRFTFCVGERHPRTNLKNSDIPKIRRAYRKGGIGRLAAQYGIHRTTMSDIIFSKSWKHIPAASKENP